MRRTLTVLASAIMPVALAASAFAADTAAVHLVIKDHRFMPSEITVPAGKRVELIVENRDPTPEEFESYDLRREKIVVGHGTVSVWVGPLPPGTYGFFGDYNKKTAQGTLIAK